jgi:hypothetical protein
MFSFFKSIRLELVTIILALSAKMTGINLVFINFDKSFM